MIHWVQGDIFDAPTEALVNTVNCLGVSGKGIALQVKLKYPTVYAKYRDACFDNKVQIGKVYPIKLKGDFEYILCFPTKYDWKKNSQLEWIETGLSDLVKQARRLKLQSIAVPALGCANGGLSWKDVKPLIESKLSKSKRDYHVYEPL